jgi:hypothetical protein
VIFDPDLIGRIESSAARVMLSIAAAYIAHEATDPARAVVFGDGALVAFGPGRYVNRAVGISLADLDDDQLDELEAFYAASGLPPSLEVASWAPPRLLERLAARGYVVQWFRNIYVAALDGHAVPDHPSMMVREVTAATLPEWLAVVRAGHGLTTPEDAAVSDGYARAAHAIAGATDYLADVDGVAAGCGSLVREGGIGWLGGAATVPAYRQRGVQGALVRRRMAAAYASGCDLAVATAMPSGGSARNLARLGFTLAYCQAVLTKP